MEFNYRESDYMEMVFYSIIIYSLVDSSDFWLVFNTKDFSTFYYFFINYKINDIKCVRDNCYKYYVFKY